MVYDELCRFLGTKPEWKPYYPSTKDSRIKIKQAGRLIDILPSVIERIYKIDEDDRKFRESLKLNGNDHLNYFDILRKEYIPRREFDNYLIEFDKENPAYFSSLSSLRFNVKTPLKPS